MVSPEYQRGMMASDPAWTLKGCVAAEDLVAGQRARIAALEAELARVREERDNLQMYLAAGETVENWNLAQQYRTERDEARSALATTRPVIEAAKNVFTTFNGGFIVCTKCGEQETTTDCDFVPELGAALEQYERTIQQEGGDVG